MSEENFRALVAESVGQDVTHALSDLGLLTSDPVRKAGSPLDTLSLYLASRLRLGKYAGLWCGYVFGLFNI